MQKSSSSGGVRTLSIIDTLSQVVKEEPAKLLLDDNHNNKLGKQQQQQQPPQLQKRSPKVNVPSTPPFNGSRPLSSLSATTSPVVNGFATSSPNNNSIAISNVSDAVLGARRKKKKRRPINGLGPNGGGANGGQATPDWIRDIFDHARRGAVDKLSTSIAGLEPPLLRNLTDHRGNSLLHCACARGHVNLLPLLTRRFGQELRGALVNDENSAGVTPPVLAIKLGQLECVRWLVRNTCLREAALTSPQNGEQQPQRHRTLLHHAARYGKDHILEFLCSEMSGHSEMLSARDGGGNSALHLSAKRGSLSCASVLLRHGASAAAKNDMGLRPADVAAAVAGQKRAVGAAAAVAGQKRAVGAAECADFLRLYEASFELAGEAVDSRAKLDAVRAEHDELKGYFKDVLTISKKLAKERDEMCRELGRLYESMMELHNNMTMEIQVLAKENAELSKKKENSSNNNNRSDSSKNILESCTSLHQRWQQHQRQWFSSGLIDSEHKLMVTEEAWKKMRGQQQQQQQDASYVQRMLRDRLEELNNRPRPLPATSIQMSSTDEDEDVDSDATTTEEYEMRRVRRNMAQRKKLDTPSPPSNKGNLGGEGESIYTSVSNEMYSKIGSPPGSNRQSSLPGSLTRGRGASTTPSPTAALSSGARRRVVRSREELRQKLREFALTSETGSASVLEVIEPTSSEEEEFKRSMRKMNMTWSGMEGRYVNGGVEGTTTQRSSNRDSPASSSTKSQNGDDDGVAGKKNFFQKQITKWKKKGRKEPAGREDDEDEDGNALLSRAEEHVLPDNFGDPVNDEEEEGRHSLTISVGSGGNKDFDRAGSSRSTDAITAVRRISAQTAVVEARKSLSPQSRKSSSSLAGKSSMSGGAPSVATSDDSGIVLAGNGGVANGGGVRPSSRSDSNHSRPGSRIALIEQQRSPTTTLNRIADPANNDNVNQQRLGKIEEVSVASSRSSSTIPASGPHQLYPPHDRRSVSSSVNSGSNSALMMTPLNLLRKKSLESKAWYDVPSDDERRANGGGADAVEEEEADSLASIISTRGGSTSDED